MACNQVRQLGSARGGLTCEPQRFRSNAATQPSGPYEPKRQLSSKVVCVNNLLIDCCWVFFFILVRNKCWTALDIKLFNRWLVQHGNKKKEKRPGSVQHNKSSFQLFYNSLTLQYQISFVYFMKSQCVKMPFCHFTRGRRPDEVLALETAEGYGYGQEIFKTAQFVLCIEFLKISSVVLSYQCT